MNGRLQVYAWDETGRVYRHLGSLPGDHVPTAWWVAGNTIRLAPTVSSAIPVFRAGPPEGVNESFLFIEGHVTELVPVGLALVVPTESVPDLPRVRGWELRPKPKAKAPTAEVDA